MTLDGIAGVSFSKPVTQKLIVYFVLNCLIYVEKNKFCYSFIFIFKTTKIVKLIILYV